MRIFVPRETRPGERRVPVVPAGAKRLAQLGAEVEVEANAGAAIGAADADYTAAGAAISRDRRQSLCAADLVLRLNKPPVEEIPLLKKGAIHVSHLDPFNERALIEALARAGVSAIAMELIPRTTLAQQMDALSSQANLAGYVAVIMAAARLNRILPMMMTPAGMITPARVFVIGAGVAGLQAIATAKRVGARVEAFDTRPVVEDQVKSLGARFVKLDLGETGQTRNGYARALTSEQIQRQRDAMAKHCAEADIVITTAQVFGRKAPLIVTTGMVKGMRPGSVVVDLAAETGGNVECVRAGEEVDVQGVRVLGFTNLAGYAPVNASQVYSSNVGSLVEHFWDRERKTFNVNREDEIIRGCLVTHAGEIVNEIVRNAGSK